MIDKNALIDNDFYKLSSSGGLGCIDTFYIIAVMSK